MCAHGGIDEAALPRRLSCASCDTAAELAPGRSVASIFFGGGTPSLMGPQTVGAILDAHRRALDGRADAEITLEANPIERGGARFRGYRAAGVNRVSLGVQSLDDPSCGRSAVCTRVDEALAAHRVSPATFARVSFDLIYARPGQTRRSMARPSSTRALSLAGGHLSLYQLTIEPGTPFAALHARGKLKVPDSELASALYALTQELSERRGCRPTRSPTTRGRDGVPPQPALLARANMPASAPARTAASPRSTRKRARSRDQVAGGLACRGRGSGHGLISEEDLSTGMRREYL